MSGNIAVEDMNKVLQNLSSVLRDCKPNDKDELPVMDAKIFRLMNAMESTGMVELFEKFGANVPIEINTKEDKKEVKEKKA
jgi:hypothetical protein